MVKIVAVGGPKGGVGKTTTTVALASVFAEHAPGTKHLVVDADPNRNALLYVQAIGELLPEVDTGTADAETVSHLRHVTGYDFVWIDLPPTRESGQLSAILDGDGGGPVADLLVVPMIPAAFDLWSTAPWIEADVAPSGVPYGIVLSKVRPVSLAEALEWRAQLEAQHLDTFATLLREYKAVTEAQAAGRPLTRYGGKHSGARTAEDDYRSLAREVAKRLGLRITIPTRDHQTGG